MHEVGAFRSSASMETSKLWKEVNNYGNKVASDLEACSSKLLLRRRHSSESIFRLGGGLEGGISLANP